MKAIELIHEINNTSENDATIQKVTAAAPTPEQIINGIRLYRTIIILALKFTKIFTGKKADQKIDEAIALLNLA